MNQRLKELVEQASSGACYDEPGAVTLYNDEIKKFAELIIKECIRLCDQVDIVGADECIDNIKEHFGIEQ